MRTVTACGLQSFLLPISGVSCEMTQEMKNGRTLGDKHGSNLAHVRIQFQICFILFQIRGALTERSVAQVSLRGVTSFPYPCPVY
ncbi:hypothetical protein O3P69_011785 [Scylla paramamosain]|uniref:Secreted protein n=1 Tax=Scylla paramamosain TaxID=85552 RepID=A0AAW0SDU2_SCYPA